MRPMLTGFLRIESLGTKVRVCFSLLPWFASSFQSFHWAIQTKIQFSDLTGCLRHARKNGFDKSIQQGVERLKVPHNAEIVTGNPFEVSCDPIFGLGQLGPPVQFVMDCCPDERTRARIAPRFEHFVDPIPIFSAQSKR